VLHVNNISNNNNTSHVRCVFFDSISYYVHNNTCQVSSVFFMLFSHVSYVFLDAISYHVNNNTNNTTLAACFWMLFCIMLVITLVKLAACFWMLLRIMFIITLARQSRRLSLLKKSAAEDEKKFSIIGIDVMIIAAELDCAERSGVNIEELRTETS